MGAHDANPIPRARERFQARFGRSPRHVTTAPARVNLIGEHVDYNDGLVLPIVIDRHIAVAGAPSPGSRVTIVSGWAGDELALEGGNVVGDAPSWSAYPRGVLAQLAGHGLVPGGFDAWIESTIPAGAGLASSAALEVAVASLVEQLTGTRLAPPAKARLCRQAEHLDAGVPCGIMDQIACVIGTPETALLIDCRSEAITPVPLWGDDLSLVVVDSGVRHALADGAYAARRDECAEACRRLGVPALRDVDLTTLERHADRLDGVLVARVRHVVTEIDRTRGAAEAARAGAWTTFGGLMTDSHRSLRDDYEVSGPELDELVELLLAVDGVLGARLTGAGFGGCVIALAARDGVPEIRRRIDQLRSRRTGANVIVSR
ncbi:MAG: galactokinase [Planctomycetes bacterium]|nr:galactokinase [Planctomycetota bacterium]